MSSFKTMLWNWTFYYINASGRVAWTNSTAHTQEEAESHLTEFVRSRFYRITRCLPDAIDPRSTLSTAPYSRS